MKANNTPQGKLDEVPQAEVRQIVSSLRDLYDMGKPQTDMDVDIRIDQYFQFCEESSIRPGIESLCLALHVSRQTLYNWSIGYGCSAIRQESVVRAKMFISSYIEQTMLAGKINPVSAIFLCKNWMGYKDSYSFDDIISDKPRQVLSVADLPKLSDTAKLISEELGGIDEDGTV